MAANEASVNAVVNQSDISQQIDVKQANFTQKLNRIVNLES